MAECIWIYVGATPDNATANVTVDEYHRYMVCEKSDFSTSFL